MANITFQGRLGRDPEFKTISTTNGDANLVEISVAEDQPRMEKPKWRRVTIFESDSPRLYGFIKRMADDSKIKSGSSMLVNAEETYTEGSDGKVYANWRALSLHYTIGGPSKKNGASTASSNGSTDSTSATTAGTDTDEWNRPSGSEASSGETSTETEA